MRRHHAQTIRANAVVERFQGTVLAEFYRPHFHRVRVDALAELDAPLQAWTADYNRRRRNRGDLHARHPPAGDDELQTDSDRWTTTSRSLGARNGQANGSPTKNVGITTVEGATRIALRGL